MIEREMGRWAGLGLVVAGSLAGCGALKGGEDTTELVWYAQDLPAAAWDPLAMDAELCHFTDGEQVYDREGRRDCADLGSPPEPVVLDQGGAEVALETREYDGGHVKWVSRDGFSPGEYEVVGFVGAPGYPISQTFAVGAWGQDEGFDAAGVVGVPYEVVGGTFFLMPVDMLTGSFGRLALELLSVEGDQASFRLVSRQEGFDCSVLRDTGHLDSQGLLTWSRDRLMVDMGATDLLAEDLSLTVGWDSGASDEAHAVATVRVDTEPLAYLVTAEDEEPAGDALCTLANTLGLACTACAEGQPSCLASTAYGVVLQRDAAHPIDAELAACGVEDEDLGVFSCDVDPGDIEIGCSTVGLQAGGPGLLAGLWLLVAGRRR
ncbi:MAG: hypothetical protein JXX28_09745 [Deltaproteobacteria bacterium]|nr:hypothetical protein [Deltaproteobacteria bacterium]